jgi:hypothetical protein
MAFWKSRQTQLKDRLSRLVAKRSPSAAVRNASTATSNQTSSPELPESNSLLEAIAAHEREDARVTAGRFQSQSDSESTPPPINAASPNKTAHYSSFDVSTDEVAGVSDADRLQSIANALAEPVGQAKCFTLGFATLGPTDHSAFAIYKVVAKLTADLRRKSVLVSARQSIGTTRKSIQEIEFELTQGTTRPAEASVIELSDDVRLESWNESAATANTFAIMQRGLSELPELKRKFRIVAIDLGGANEAWVEPLGRMCDSVCLLIPAKKMCRPQDALRAASQLEAAGIHLAGSIPLCPAA